MCRLAMEEPTYARNGRVAGFPVQTPLVDVHTIGAGGRQHRGPGCGRRPGGRGRARPGPNRARVAYGRGGQEPTVTDANVFLERIPPDATLAGGLQLDRKAVARAMKRFSRQAGLTPRATAEGIVSVVVTRMARAVRAITLERGRDPRDFTLVAFGGAAGLHAADLASTLGITRVLVPAHSRRAQRVRPDCRTRPAGAIAHRDAAGRRGRAGSVDPASTRPLAETAREALRNEGVRARAIQLERLVDCRYAGQSFELTVPFGRDYVEQFHAAHQTTFGFQAPDRPVEAVTLRVRARGPDPDPPLPSARPDWPAGTVRPGPLSIPFKTSTIHVPRGWQAVSNDFGGVLLTPER